tara:strand:- start:1836 stop:2285 length:450 start_codon:yes stop_codon:yes gene_type:complete
MLPQDINWQTDTRPTQALNCLSSREMTSKMLLNTRDYPHERRQPEESVKQRGMAVSIPPTATSTALTRIIHPADLEKHHVGQSGTPAGQRSQYGQNSCLTLGIIAYFVTVKTGRKPSASTLAYTDALLGTGGWCAGVSGMNRLLLADRG